MSRRMVIIGAGLGGLATALRSAVHGWTVTVCEQGATVGGKMNIFESNGFRFDTGPSLITLPHIFQDLFASAGERFEDYCTLRRLSPLTQYRYPDGTKLLYPAPLPEMLEGIRSIEPSDVDGFWRFMKLGAKIYELSRGTFFTRSPFSPPSFREIGALKHFPLRYAWGNYAATVAAHFRSPHLRQLFNRYPTYVGSSPYLAPATLAVIPYIEFAYGGWYVDGGLYSITRSIETMLNKRNVDIRTSSRVVQILLSGGRVRGVLLESGEQIDADVVVMNGDTAVSQRLLDPAKHAANHSDRDEEKSLSAVVFLVGVKKRIESLSHHTILFSADYEKEFHQLFTERKFPDDPTLYINVTSKTDPAAAPAGSESMFIMANAPAYDVQRWNTSAVRKVWMQVTHKLRSAGAIFDESDIAVREVWTPARFETSYGTPGGSIYGRASHSWKTTFFRTSNKDRAVKGLYNVGGTSHPGGGTPMVLLSASITSSLIEKYEHS